MAKKLESGLYVVQMVLSRDELPQFSHMVKASDRTESAFMREMCGFEPKRRGAPIGNKNRAGKKRAKPQPETLMYEVN